MSRYTIKKEELLRLIREELEGFKSEYDRAQYLRDQQKRYQKERQARDEAYPESLRSLARGVLSEGEVIYNDDQTDEFVKIKKSALKRLLTDSDNSKIQKLCNSRGYRTLAQFLKLQSLYFDSAKGKLTPDQK